LLRSREKLFICLRIIEVYERRIFAKMDYRMLMLEDIVVVNFNRVNLNLVTVRVQHNNRNHQPNQPNQSSQHDQNNQS
jgi:hypothetical protein